MKGKFKPTILILFYFALLTSSANAATLLESADSLFYAKKYTTAFEQYDSAYQTGVVSPSMLLKMAFIKEGLGDHTLALYYLNAYYKLTSNRATLTKMQELAAKNNLSGYEVEDRHFFLNALSKFDLEIQSVLAALILLLSAAIYRSKKRGEMAIGLPVIQLLLVGALLTVSNGWFVPKQAIISTSTFLMTAPSAAAEPVTEVKKGHLVEIVGQSEAWVKIKWEGKDVYIRHAKIKVL